MGVLTQQVYYRVFGNSVALAVHGCNSVAMFLALQGEVMKDPEIVIMKSSQFKYITIWNVIFQMVFLTMSLASDIPIIMKVKNEHKVIGILRSYNKVFFAGVVWPCSVLICLIFWPMYIYDREMLFPAYIDKALSQVSNHVMHTSILPIALWTLVFQPRTKPKTQFWYLAHLGTLFVCYFSFLLYNYSTTGTWPYPILNTVYGTIYFPIFYIIKKNNTQPYTNTNYHENHPRFEIFTNIGMVEELDRSVCTSHNSTYQEV